MTDSQIVTPPNPGNTESVSREIEDLKTQVAQSTVDITKLKSKIEEQKEEYNNKITDQQKNHDRWIYGFIIVTLLAILAIAVAIGLDYFQTTSYRSEHIAVNQKNIQNLKQKLNKNIKILSKDHDYIEQVIGYNKHQYRNNPRSMKNK